MFNTEFNSLYVSTQSFILNENASPTFSDPESQIKYYKSIVDEYNVLVFNLTNIQKQLNSTTELYTEITDTLVKLASTFEKYEGKSAIVRSYLNELAVLSKKVTFAEKLYRFEELFRVTPLVKISVDELQSILTYARTYVNDAVSFYYY
jgi:hypothetical protein